MLNFHIMFINAKLSLFGCSRQKYKKVSVRYGYIEILYIVNTIGKLRYLRYFSGLECGFRGQLTPSIP